MHVWVSIGEPGKFLLQGFFEKVLGSISYAVSLVLGWYTG
jgi:hypothetical protein